MSLKEGVNQLDFYIRNTTEKFGGFRSSPYIGSFDNMVKLYEKRVFRDTIICGASLVMFLFFFILFLNYRNDKSTLYFSLICLFLSLRGLVTNDKVIFIFIPNLSYLLLNKIEYFSVYLIPLLTILFIYNYYEKKVYKHIFKVCIYFGFILVLASLLGPPVLYISLLYVFYGYIIIGGILIITTLINCGINGKEDAFKILVSIITLLLAGVCDSINYILNKSDVQVLPSSMIVFILLMSLIVSQREIRKLKKIDKLSKENIKVIKYLSKFVPNAFIKTVGMGDITSISRGVGVNKDMTVLFTSIIGFQQELKLYKAEDTISLLNRCFGMISPIITSYGGFIDKFIDETVMALFPGKPEDAIDAVMEINKKLEQFNRGLGHGKPLRMKAGIHNGEQYIGLVGDQNRVDATVISKVVNTASRINSFTSKIDRDILISDDVYRSIKCPEDYKTMYMGRVKLKGKENFIGIHCLYLNKVVEADNLFSITMKKLEDSSLDKIENVLLNIKRMHKNHKPTDYYLQLIKNNKTLEELEK